jgi:hypothetical protein
MKTKVVLLHNLFRFVMFNHVPLSRHDLSSVGAEPANETGRNRKAL